MFHRFFASPPPHFPLKRKILYASMLVAPAAVMLATAQPALADCAVTAGGGTVASPADGATITCTTTGGDQTSTIGDGTDNFSATVDVQAGATVDVAGNAIDVDNATVTLGTGVSVMTTGGASEAIQSESGANSITQDVTAGDNVQISTVSNGAHAIFALSLNNTVTQTVTLSGANVQVITQGANGASGIFANGASANPLTQRVTLSGAGTSVNVAGTNSVGISAINGSGAAQTDITLGVNTSVVSQQAVGIFLLGAAGSPDSSIDSAGLVQGATNSIFVGTANSDESLTLRTGSNLSSTNGADLGGGTDTLTLIGNASEDEIFLNIENLEVDADATGWELTSTSTFDDININTGRFRNNGNITVNNLLTVDSGSIFGGTGTTGGNVTNNGTVAPGNSVGTQVINGNFVQGAGGTLAIEFDNTGIDFLDISGTATLDGAVTFTEFAPGVSFDTPLTFLDADGGITGTFSSIPQTVATSEGLATASVEIGAGGGQLGILTLSRGSTLSGAGGDRSSDAVVTGLDNASGSDGAAAVAIVNTLNSSASVADALASQSGVASKAAITTAGAALQKVTYVVQGRFSPHGKAVEAVKNTGISAGDVAQVEPAAGGDTGGFGSFFAAPERTYWLQGVGGFGDVDGDARSRGAEYNTYGAAAGVEAEPDDWQFAGWKDIKIGAFAAYSVTETDIDGLSDEAEADAYQLGLYGAARRDQNWHVNGALSAAFLDFETTRPTVQGMAKGDFNGYGGYAYGEALYDIPLAGGVGNAVLSPYLRGEGTIIYQDSYSESGAGTLNMRVNSETTTQFSSELGVQYSSTYETQDYAFYPSARLGWAHQFLDQSTDARANFTAAPSTSFDSEGPKKNRDSAKINLDLTIAGRDGATALYTSYDGRIAADAQDHLFTAGLKIKW